MRIGFDAKRALNNGTGLGNHARILLHALMRDYPLNDYHLFTPKAQDVFFDALQGDFHIHFPQTKLQQSFRALWRSRGMVSALYRERIEVYHGLSNEIPWGIAPSRIKTVVTIHDLIFLKHREQYPWIDRQIYEQKTRYAAKHADHIIAVSEETKRDIIQYYGVKPDKITVIYPSVGAEFQQAYRAESPVAVAQKYGLPAKYVLHVGSFFPRKNQATLIEAFALIEAKVAEDLVLVGKGKLLHRMQELAVAKNLQKRIHFLTETAAGDLPALYRAASAFVFPSLYEGFGAPVLEALFSSVPVVAARGGAVEEAAGKEALLIAPRSPQDIAEKLLTVLNDAALRRRMIAAGLAHAQTMTDTLFAQKTMAVYQRL